MNNIKKPNLIIVGSQKCGTTWLYRALNLSEQIYGPKVKELHYWDSLKPSSFESYLENFADAPDDIKFIFESTPGYFRMPNNNFDVAKRIYDGLGDIPLIVIVRNPVDRYLSAYTHHMLRGRLPVVETVDLFTEKRHLLEFGLYSKIYRHFKKYFTNIHIFFYDDLKEDYKGLLENVFGKLKLEIDFDITDADFKANDKVTNKKRLANKFNEKDAVGKLPVLSNRLEKRLKEYYKDSIEELEAIIGRSLDSWK